MTNFPYLTEHQIEQRNLTPEKNRVSSVPEYSIWTYLGEIQCKDSKRRAGVVVVVAIVVVVVNTVVVVVTIVVVVVTCWPRLPTTHRLPKKCDRESTVPYPMKKRTWEKIAAEFIRKFVTFSLIGIFHLNVSFARWALRSRICNESARYAVS